MFGSLCHRGGGELCIAFLCLGITLTTQHDAYFVHRESSLNDSPEKDTAEPVPVHNSSPRYPNVFHHPGVDHHSPLASTMFALPEDLLRASVGNLGDTARMRHFIHTLKSDRLVRVTILGGSVAQGCCIPGQNLYLMSSPATFANRLFEWLPRVFPRPKYILRNKAYSSMVAAYVNACFEEFFDPAEKPEAELVILEFNCNERYFSSMNRTEGRTEYETLLRSLLALPSKAAVIMLHWFTAPYVEPFLLSPEGAYDELARYYEVPSLSWRAVQWRMAREPTLRLPAVYYDYVHPTRAGHRYIFDMLAAAIRDEALMAEALGSGHPHATVSLDLPRPLLPDKDVQGERYCAVKDGLRPLLVSSQGWDWTDEPSKGGLSRTGYVSKTAGSSITFRLPPRREGAAAKPSGYIGASLGVGNLRSYNNMGIFSVFCTRGCACGANAQSAHWENRLSIIQWEYIPLNVTDYASCLITIEISAATHSGGHKVKVDSLFFSEKHRWDMCNGCSDRPRGLVQ